MRGDPPTRIITQPSALIRSSPLKIATGNTRASMADNPSLENKRCLPTGTLSRSRHPSNQRRFHPKRSSKRGWRVVRNRKKAHSLVVLARGHGGGKKCGDSCGVRRRVTGYCSLKSDALQATPNNCRMSAKGRPGSATRPSCVEARRASGEAGIDCGGRGSGDERGARGLGCVFARGSYK